MVCWVAERARAARNVDRVIVATDSQQIIDVVQASGIEAVLTSPNHTSGTDRVAEVAATIPDAKIIVNVQGDEPMISPETIERAVDAMAVGDVQTKRRGNRNDLGTDRIDRRLAQSGFSEGGFGRERKRCLLFAFADTISARRSEKAWLA